MITYSTWIMSIRGAIAEDLLLSGEGKSCGESSGVLRGLRSYGGELKKNQMVCQRRSQLAGCSGFQRPQCWQIAWRQVEKLYDTADLGIAKEQVKKAKIWILDSTSLMKALNVLIEIPA